VPRLGRKTRLAEPQRATLWEIFSNVLGQLKSANKTTQAGVYERLIAKLKAGGTSPYQHIVVDEAQDISVMALRYLATVASGTENGLFFAGDSGQRIFQLPFSWKAQGVEVRGRARNLRVNYRTSHQIRSHADRLLDPEVTDVDGNVETRKGTVSVFNGPTPLVSVAADQGQEGSAVERWLKERLAAGFLPHEIGVFVRSDAQIPRATAALERAGLAYRVLDQKVTTATGSVSVATMHLAKGLEFRGVAVMACDDEVVPLQERLQEVGDDADLKYVYETERHLLYVACTRARDELLITAVSPESEFLVDLTRKR
jgi:superfamily I DNA/RNA helicase